MEKVMAYCIAGKKHKFVCAFQRTESRFANTLGEKETVLEDPLIFCEFCSRRANGEDVLLIEHK